MTKSHEKLYSEHHDLGRFQTDSWPHLHVFDNGILAFEPGGPDVWFYEPDHDKWFQKEYSALSDLWAGKIPYTTHRGPNAFIYLTRRFAGDDAPVKLLKGD